MSCPVATGTCAGGSGTGLIALAYLRDSEVVLVEAWLAALLSPVERLAMASGLRVAGWRSSRCLEYDDEDSDCALPLVDGTVSGAYRFVLDTEAVRTQIVRDDDTAV